MVFFSDKWKIYNIENNKISKWSIVWFRCYFNELTVKQCVLMTQQITKTSNCIEVFLQREHTCLVLEVKTPLKTERERMQNSEQIV